MADVDLLFGATVRDVVLPTDLVGDLVLVDVDVEEEGEGE